MKDAPLIHPQLSNEEQAKVDEIFAGVEEHLGFVPDGLKLYSVSPPLLEAFLGALGYFLSHPSLGIEYLVSLGFTQREIFEAEALGTNNRSFTTMLKAFHVHQQGAFA